MAREADSMNPVQLSVVLPAKNEGKMLGSVLDSLFLAIDHSGWRCEIIVVDNGSTDDTSAVARSRGCTVLADAAGSIAGLRNAGGRMGRGELLAFLDADCLVAPQWITFCTEKFADNTVAVVGTRAVPDPANPTWVERAWYRLITGSERPDFPEWLGTSNLFVRREVFDEIGGFNEELQTAEDVDFCRRVRAKYRIFLEKRVDTIHLRESKTIRELFTREVRRGRSSLRHFLKSADRWKDFISTFAPLVFLLAVIAFLFCLVTTLDRRVSAIFALVLVAVPLAFIAKKRAVLAGIDDFLKVYAVCVVYIFARSISACGEIFLLLSSKRTVR